MVFKKNQILLFTFLILFSNAFNCFAVLFTDSLVTPQVRSSPTMISNLLTSSAKYLKVTYGQPFKKDRVVFGNLVPYNEVWRTGANEATEITLNSSFKIGEKSFKAGTYTLFTIPSVKSWKVILNEKLGQWGAFNYESKYNVLEFETPVIQLSEVYEAFTIELFEKEKNRVELSIAWDSSKVSFPIILENFKIEAQKAEEKKKCWLRRNKSTN